MQSLRGHLLVAGSGLDDPNFRRTVVLIGEHGDDGAMGVVLNRVSPVTVEDAVPPIAALTHPTLAQSKSTRAGRRVNRVSTSISSELTKK